MKAFGIEYSLANASINQYQFIAINAFLRFNTLNEEQLIIIWCRIFDPIAKGRVTAQEYMQLLDSLSRGKLTKDSTLLSRMFEDKMLISMSTRNCFDPNNADLVMSRFKLMLEKKKMDVNVFNQMIAGGLTGTL